MRKRTIWSIVATVAIVLMVSAMIPITTAQGPLTNTMGKSAQPVNDEFGVLTNGTANNSYKQGDLVKSLAELANPLFGAFNKSGDNVTGRYVSFTVNGSTGSIMNYSLNPAVGSNVTLLSSVEVNGFNLGGGTVKGPLFVASNGTFGMAIHDNPEGTMHMASTGPAEVNLTLATGLTVGTLASNFQNLKAWMITGNGVNCVLMVWNGTVTPVAAGNKTTNQTTPVANENATNATNMTGMSQKPGGEVLSIALENNSFAVLRAIPNEPGFSQADQAAIANAIVNGKVNTGMSIQSVMVKAVSVNVTAGNATGNMTAGNQTANRTANVTSTSAMITMWYAVEFFNYSMTQVTNVTQGNVTIEITSLAGNATNSAGNATGNATSNMTAGNQTANATANQTAGNATVNMPKIWVINVDDLTLGVGNKLASVTLDGVKLNRVSSMQALESGNATSAYYMASGTNANKFIVSIADPSVNHTVQISTLAGAAGNITGNTTTGNATSTAGASGAGAVGIGIVGIAGIAATVLVVRRKK